MMNKQQSTMQSWSIIVLCYNEAGTIKKVIDQSLTVLRLMGADDYEILVVDDGSTDGSAELVKAYYGGHSKVKLLKHSHNKGIGPALRTGYFNASKENVCMVPADGQFDLNELLHFRQVPPNTFVSFYRKENTSYSLTRNILSLANKLVNRWLNGIDLKDVNWVKIYKRETLYFLDLEIESSLVESEICAKLLYLGHQPKEVVSKYLPRDAGVSKGASLKIVLQAAQDIIRLYRALKSFKRSTASSTARATTYTEAAFKVS